jgi:large subunit ribosomal protein L30
MSENQKLIKLTQIGSQHGRKPGQRETLLGLGLGKIGSSRVVQDTPCAQGMIRKVAHLLRVDESV